jgi:hypothetical protein
MSRHLTTVLWAVSVSGTLIGFVGWRVHASRTQPVPQYEIVEDLSGSHPDGCSSLLGRASLAKGVDCVEFSADRNNLVTPWARFLHMPGCRHLDKENGAYLSLNSGTQ